MGKSAPAHTAAPPQRTPLLPMPEVSQDLQVASSLLLLLHPALRPLQPAFSLAVLLLG